MPDGQLRDEGDHGACRDQAEQNVKVGGARDDPGDEAGRAHARWIISAQLVPARGAGNGWPARERGSTSLSPAAGACAGAAANTGSRPGSRRSKSGSSELGRTSYSCATATSVSPRNTAGSDSSGSVSTRSSCNVRRGPGQHGPGGRHHGGRGGREGGQGHPASGLVAERGEVGLGRVELGQQSVGVGNQDVGGRDAASA